MADHDTVLESLIEHLCAEISAALTTHGITPQAVVATLPQARQRVFERWQAEAEPKTCTLEDSWRMADQNPKPKKPMALAEMDAAKAERKW